uniref:Uncharacterized protein n=1 Tax=Chenopodium quinoa TaxID=63459 RepID=A0A803NDU2_CHEQI
MTVVLTSRDTEVGIEAVKVLQEADLLVDFHQLDIVDPQSIKEFAEWIKVTYGGLDILVNNAGVNFDVGSENSVEHAEQRIEDVSLREQLSNDDLLTEELIDNTLKTFLQQTKDGSWTLGGWPQNSTVYSMSKLAVNCYSRYLARKLCDRPEDTGVWLALLAGQPVVNGKFFAERREIHF